MFSFKVKNLFVKTTLVLTILFISSSKCWGQKEFVWDSLLVDTISIKAKKGFEPEDFIRMTKEDTSFLRAFKNLKFFPHQSKSHVKVFNKNFEQIAELKRTAKHLSDGKKGSIKILSEKTDGRVYKRNGNHKYFTAEMYDKVFFPSEPFPVGNTVGEAYEQQKAQKKFSKEEKYYEQLKTFMFSPGTGVEGVPLIGRKLDIFDGKTRKHYDFSIEKTDFKDSIPCYKFICKPKPEVKGDKVVITNLVTFYDRRTMQIIARRYSLKQSTPLFSFDINMFIQLKYEFDEYLPVQIKYSGDWDVPMKKPERISFSMVCDDYTLPK